MKQPLVSIKWFGWSLLLILLFASMVVPVQADQALTAMSKDESPHQTKLILKLTEMPAFELRHSGQRVDLEIQNAGVAPSLHSLPEDQSIVKVMLAKKHDALLISYLLRRLPQQVVAESKDNPPRIELNIYWEQGSEGARPGVAFRIADLPPRKAGPGVAKSLLRSPWEDDWLAFFEEYRSLWTLDLPLTYTLPSLPQLISDEQSVLWPLQDFANRGMFLSLLQEATALSDLAEEELYLRDVIVAEAQLRTDALEAATARLDALRDLGGSQQARVEYLTAYAQGVAGQPLVAQLTLGGRLPQLAEQDPFLPLYQLLYAETSLDSKQDKEALGHLGSGINWPDSLLSIVDLRRADALAGLGDMQAASEIYTDLAEEPGLFEHYLFSFNRAAFNAFKLQNYEFSYHLYRQLADLALELPGSDLVLYASGAAALESGDLGWGLVGLQRATLDRPGSEGGDRAELLMIDLKVNNDGDMALLDAADAYGDLARRSNSRAVREEAYFKQALAHYLLGENVQSVDELMTFNRDFRSSALRREAELLLAKQLPGLIRSLIDEQDDLKAVVLVEQNRKLLLNDKLGRDFLNDVAKAFDRLGLYERATKVLLYLFDQSRGRAEREDLYLPLAESYQKQGEYARASEYSENYLKRYPKGDDAGPHYQILLDSLARQERNQELLEWLRKGDRPTSVDLEKRAAQAYWDQGDYLAVIDSLNKVMQMGGDLQVKEMAQLAEASYQIGQLSAADSYYRALFEDPEFSSQARYRVAQIGLKSGDKAESLKLLENLVEKDGVSGWGKLARDLLLVENR